MMTQEAPAIDRHTPAGLALDAERATHALFAARNYISRDRWDGCLDIRLQLSVFVPMPRISLQSLLALQSGQILEAGWQASQDIPMMVEGRFLANGELEPVGDRLGVRINSFTDQLKNTLTTGNDKGGVPGGTAVDEPRELQRLCSLEDLKLTPLLFFGETALPMRDVLGLCVGDIVVLDRPVIAPVKLAAGGRIVAEGELVLVDGGYAVRVNTVAELKRHLPPNNTAF